eukprot:1100952-Pleurochrysis_carterae.AAC.1
MGRKYDHLRVHLRMAKLLPTFCQLRASPAPSGWFGGAQLRVERPEPGPRVSSWHQVHITEAISVRCIMEFGGSPLAQ